MLNKLAEAKVFFFLAYTKINLVKAKILLTPKYFLDKAKNHLPCESDYQLSCM